LLRVWAYVHNGLMEHIALSFFSILSILTLVVVYSFLITEKINKVIVAVFGAAFLIFMQVFRTATHTSQDKAFEFISRNMDVLGFVVGMMILVGIVRESGLFEAIAVWIVKKVKGKPIPLLIALSYLTLFMTATLSNIPTVLIVTPILLVLIKELKLPAIPYFIALITMANIGGAMTPISDPTTYYQAKTVGLSFFEVVSNSGLIVMILSAISVAYIILIFKKQLDAVIISDEDVKQYDPKSAIKNRALLKIGTPILVLAILLMVFKEAIRSSFDITLDNASISLFSAFLVMFVFRNEPKKVFQELIDWEIIFFFSGLFIIVGALEFTRVIDLLAQSLISMTGGNITLLLGFLSIGSGVISTFIDNVPYNITMVGAVQLMAAQGIMVYPLWWALNLGTSIGGAGSPIGAACNVVALGQAEKEGIHIPFMKYLMIGLPLVVINSIVTFGVIWLRYLH
jgi:Na+/H+ antiporter NhaD/arsenite permease-like protein